MSISITLNPGNPQFYNNVQYVGGQNVIADNATAAAWIAAGIGYVSPNQPAGLVEQFPSTAAFAAALTPGVAAVGMVNGVIYTSADGVTSSGVGSATSNSQVISFADFSAVTDGTNVVSGFTPQIGSAFTNPGAPSVLVQGGLAVQKTDATNYAYITGVCAENISRIAVEFALFGAVTNVQLLTIMIGKNTTLASSVLHLNIQSNGYVLSIRTAGNSSEFATQGNWTEQLNFGGQLYRVELVINGDRAMILGPNGECVPITDPRIGGVSGTNYFFEQRYEGSASWSGVKRIWAVGIDSANAPNALPLPNEITATTNFALNQLGYPSVYSNTPYEVSFQQAANGFSIGSIASTAINWGPTGFFGAKIITAITAGQTTCQTNSPVPNGSYTFDSITNNGALLETRTVTGSSYVSTGVYNTTVSVAFTNNHAKNIQGSPVTIQSTVQPNPTYSIGPDSANGLPQFAIFGGTVSLNSGVLNLRNGGDNYSCNFSASATNYIQAYGAGPGHATALGCTGGFRITEGVSAGGDAPYSGIATLTGVTPVVIANTQVKTGDRILLNRQTASGVLGHLSVSALTNATSFSIVSSGTETSTVYWEIRRPG